MLPLSGAQLSLPASELPTWEDLKAAYVRGDLVVFAGAEVSTSANISSLPRMVEMFTSLARMRSQEERMREMLDQLQQGHLVDALSIAEQVLTSGEFSHQVERTLNDGHVQEVPPLARAIAALRPHLKAVLTTSIDHLIERAFEWTWPSLWGEAARDLLQRRGFIFKLHGTLPERPSWVFTREQYERAGWRRAGIRDTLDRFFHASTLLFVGFELTGEYFDDLLSEVRGSAGDHPPVHYALVPEGSIQGVRRQHLQLAGIRLLEYSNADGQHTEALRLLTELAGSPPQGDTRSPAPAPALPPTQARWRDANPFPGLESFDEDRADLYFGRETEVNAALHLLGGKPERHVRWLQVEGVSGSGKSSFARAGLVPKVRLGWMGGAPQRWHVAVLKPGSQPLLGLAHAVHAALGPAQVSLEGFLQELRQSPTALASFLRQHTPPGHGVLLLVDQFEELFTLSELESARVFDRLLATALQDTGGPLYLLTTSRSDFLSRFKDLPALDALRSSHAAHYRLERMRPLALQAAIQRPAMKLGLRWEHGLPEKLLEDVAELEAGLPLLAHVLSELWARRQGNTLTREAYKSVGGITGALTRSADSLLESLGEDASYARNLLLALATRQGGLLSRRSLSRAEALDAAGGGARAEHVLARLSGGRGPGQPETAAAPPRLLVVTQAAGMERVDLVHEALLTRWATFCRWLEEERQLLERRDDLEATARVWHAAGATRSALPSGQQLAYLLTASPVTHPAREFVQRAVANARQQKKKNIYTWAFVIWVILTTTYIVSRQYLSYQETKRVTQQHLAITSNIQEFFKSLGEAGALIKSGEASQRQGRLDEAREHFQKALEIHRLLSQPRSSTSVEMGSIASQGLHQNLNKLGSLAQAQGRLDEAREFFQQALDISQTSARTDASNAGLQMNCVQDELTLGDLARARGDLEALRTHRANAERILDELQKKRALEDRNVRYMGLRAWLSE